MTTINFAVWNMEWMNDLFTEGPAYQPDNKKVRGPNPGSRENPTVLQRRQSLSGAIDEMDLDVLVVVEGPNKADELQLFFDTDVAGNWRCNVQPTKGSSQIVGIAVKTSSNKFANPPRAAVQGRAGVGSCRDAPAFPGKRGRFTRLNDEGSGRLRQMAASICRRQPVSARCDGFAPDIMAPYTHYPHKAAEQRLDSRYRPNRR